MIVHFKVFLKAIFSRPLGRAYGTVVVCLFVRLSVCLSVCPSWMCCG